jgi:uncharacterized protein YciI
MKHWVLTYDFVPDFMEKRAPLRAAHLALLQQYEARDALVLAGAFKDEPRQSLLVFKAEDPSTVEAFARADSYVTGGIVTTWRVREWVTVAGAGALTKP